MKARLGTRVLVLSLLAVSVGVSTKAPAHATTRYLDATFGVDVQQDIVYGNAVNLDGVPVTLTLDLYTPRGDTATNRPVFIWAHGGFFAFGSKEDDSGWGNRLAQRGYVVASINYRLSSSIVSAPVDSDRDFQEVNDARADMQTSVRWFRANAAMLKIDPHRIAVGGSSAGAVTALGVAVNNDDPLVAEYADYSSAVCTAVSYSGANDPLAVDSGDAGAIFHHGATDDIVPYDMAVQTRDAMIAAGLAVQWNEYAGEGHSLSGNSITLANTRSIQWLYDRVASAVHPCSPAVAHPPPLGVQSTTRLTGAAGRSAVVSLVAVSAESAGYLQALPCGTAPGSSSNLNVDLPGQTRSGLAVARFDAGGSACVFAQPRSQLVVDLQGYFAPGAFDDIADERILDTRSGPQPAGGSQTRITGRPNSTAIVSLVATQTTGPGYVQVLPCGAAPGASSNLNADAAGQTRAGLVFVRFDAEGAACVFTQTAAHLIVDVQGYMASPAFDDVADIRLLDTRSGGRPIAAASQTAITGRANSTAVVSIVATDTGAPGYVQLLPCGSTPGASSNLNVDAAGETVAGLAFVHFDQQGTACVFNQQATHLVVDLQGYLADGAFDDVADVRLIDTRTR